MLLLPPKWDAIHTQYVIDTSVELKENKAYSLLITKDTLGSTTFNDMDTLHNITNEVVAIVIREGQNGKWFSKLPSHEQLMKRIRHSFSRLALDQENQAILSSILMTPKLLTLIWTPTTVAISAPPLCFEESESDTESESESEPDIQDSSLPPVSLIDGAKESHEEYLLTRLRAAKARVEEEQIRMQYFEATGRMPPDSESDEDDE